MKSISTSILIPAYNEAGTILEILSRVNAAIAQYNAQAEFSMSFEIIVIDDASTDQTVKILECAENQALYTHLVKRSKNGGKGAAVLDGLKLARCDYILFQDADLEYFPEDYAKLFEPVERFGADLVLGSRFMAPVFTRVSYFWHKIGNRFITFFFNLFYNTTFTDLYSCYLMIRRDLIECEKLITKGWSQHAEILARSVLDAQNVYEVPIRYNGRSYAEGKKIRAQHIVGVLGIVIYCKVIGMLGISKKKKEVIYENGR